ncbi:MAG: hypothetical protein GF390_04140 [Candidatus Pacebacteria bacterium]|nr:hypothetical protein [Candidatus Paceibacterota bacterium]
MTSTSFSRYADNRIEKNKMSFWQRYFIKYRALSPAKKASVLASALILLLFIGLGLTTILFQGRLRKSQDLRQQAWNPNGTVEITSDPVNGAEFLVNEPATINLLIGTNNGGSEDLNGIQLFFDFLSPALLAEPSFQVTNSQLEEIWLNEPITDGHHLELVAIPPFVDPLNYFSVTSTPQELLTINFTPISTGTINLNFYEDSSAILAGTDGSDPNHDRLAIINNMSFEVVAPSPTPTLVPSATMTPEPTATPLPTSTPVPSATNTPIPTATNTPQASPTDAGCDPSLTADLNGDCNVDKKDYDLLVTAMLTNDTTADINNSGKVDLIDYSILVNQWTGSNP